MSSDTLSIKEFNLATFTDLDTLWSKIFSDQIREELSTEREDVSWILESLERLKTSAGLFLRIPEGEWDIAFCNNLVWVTGYLNAGNISRKVTPSYGCKDGWAVSIRTYLGPMIFFRKSVLDKVNISLNAPNMKKFLRKREKRCYKPSTPDNCYRVSHWDPEEFRSVISNPVIDSIKDPFFNTEEFFNGSWLTPKVEFQSVEYGNDPLLASPLVPSSAFDRDIRISKWGFIHNDFRRCPLEEPTEPGKDNIEATLPLDISKEIALGA